MRNTERTKVKEWKITPQKLLVKIKYRSTSKLVNHLQASIGYY